MQIVHRFLYGSDAGAKVHLFELRSDLHEALQILATDFRLSRIHGESRQGAKGRRSASRAGQQSVTHAIERRAVLFGKANANGVGAVIENYRGGGRLTFENRRGVDGDFLGSETCARRYCGIDLVCYRRATDSIFYAVKNVHDRVSFPTDFDFVECIGDAWRGFIEELAVLGKEFDDDGLRGAGQVADHVLEE